MQHPLLPKPTAKTALHHALTLSVRSKHRPHQLPKHQPLWPLKLCPHRLLKRLLHPHLHLHLLLWQKLLWPQAQQPLSLWHLWCTHP